MQIINRKLFHAVYQILTINLKIKNDSIIAPKKEIGCSVFL